MDDPVDRIVRAVDAVVRPSVPAPERTVDGEFLPGAETTLRRSSAIPL
ncbi:MAG: hypothetical protein JW775_01285 [Candidatus Aminicenantes bacterium]|nr:hypothetical protein [Candidatus Aminicenantes bacterium]